MNNNEKKAYYARLLNGSFLIEDKFEKRTDWYGKKFLIIQQSISANLYRLYKSAVRELSN